MADAPAGLRVVTESSRDISHKPVVYETRLLTVGQVVLNLSKGQFLAEAMTDLLFHGDVLGGVNQGDWPGPGRVYSGFSKDDTQWDWWQAWLAMMTA